MQPDQFAVSAIVQVLSILTAVWWLGRKIGDAATKDDLTLLKADMLRLEENVKADNIRLEESLKAEISRVEEKADQQASANEAKLLSIGEKSDYIVRQVERIESRQYHQLAGNPESAIEEELDAQ